MTAICCAERLGGGGELKKGIKRTPYMDVVSSFFVVLPHHYQPLAVKEKVVCGLYIISKKTPSGREEEGGKRHSNACCAFRISAGNWI